MSALLGKDSFGGGLSAYTLGTEMGVLQERITTLQIKALLLLVQAIYVPADDYDRPSASNDICSLRRNNKSYQDKLLN